MKMRARVLPMSVRTCVCMHARMMASGAAAAVRSDVALVFVCLQAWARARVHRAHTCALGRVCVCARSSNWPIRIKAPVSKKCEPEVIGQRHEWGKNRPDSNLLIKFSPIIIFSPT